MQPVSRNMSMSQKIYVDEVPTSQIQSDAENLNVRITGNLPSPAYTFDRFDIKVKKKTIKITPLASYDASVLAAQMLVPFDKVCKVENLEPGTYEIVIVARSDRIVRAGKVQIK